MTDLGLGSNAAEVLEAVGGTVFQYLSSVSDTAPNGTETVVVPVKLEQSGSLACTDDCDVQLLITSESIKGSMSDTDVCKVQVPQSTSCNQGAVMCKNAQEILANMQSGLAAHGGAQDEVKAPLCASYLKLENFALDSGRRRLNGRRLAAGDFGYDMNVNIPVYADPAVRAVLEAVATDTTAAAAFATSVAAELKETVAAAAAEVLTLPADKLLKLTEKISAAAVEQNVVVNVTTLAASIASVASSAVVAADTITVSAGVEVTLPPAPVVLSGTFSVSAFMTVGAAVVAAVMSF